jgi:hypothetical protein
LTEKTKIENYADIFFDFNKPIRTNTTFNTIYDVSMDIPPTSNSAKVMICQTNAAAYAGMNRSFCEQDTVYLSAQAPAFGKGSWKLIKGAAIILEATNPASLITHLGYGENIFAWKVSTNSCSTDSTSSTITIHRKPFPATPTITQRGSDSLFCNIQGTSYEWYFNGNKLEANNQQIQVSESGSYSVKVSLDNCISTLSQTFNYEKITTGLEEEFSLIKIYPNPATGSVFIEFPKELKVEVAILDAMGRTLKIDRFTSQQRKSEISLGGIKAGIYILHIETSKGVLIRKLIVR